MPKKKREDRGEKRKEQKANKDGIKEYNYENRHVFI